MLGPLIAVVGDANPSRTFDPPMTDPAAAVAAAEQLGAELARRGARLLVYGGPFIESDVVRGFVQATPKDDKSIVMWYTQKQPPPPFPEEKQNARLFERRVENGTDWEVAFYRSVSQADGLLLIGGGNATKIAGQVAIGAHMPIAALSEFGGAAAHVWETLSPGEDLPTREEITAMSHWASDSAKKIVDSLFAQITRRQTATQAKTSPALPLAAGFLFFIALAIVPLLWGQNSPEAWMLFLAPLFAGGAGSAIRATIDRTKGTPGVTQSLVGTIVLGMIAGGISSLLFVMAQMNANTNSTADLVTYSQRSILFAVGIGLIAGMTSDAVFAKLVGLDVVQTDGLTAKK